MPVETCSTCGCRFNSDYGQHLCNIQDPAVEHDRQEEEAAREDGLADGYLDTVGAIRVPKSIPDRIRDLKAQVAELTRAVASYRDTCLRWEAWAQRL